MSGHRRETALSGAARGKIPRFSMLGVVTTSAILYALLTVFLVLFVWAKSLPVAMLTTHDPVAEAAYPTFWESWLGATDLRMRHGPPLRATLFLSLAAILVIHAPLRKLLSLKRRGKPASEQLLARAEVLALRSARLTAALCFVATASDTLSRTLSLARVGYRDLAVRGIPFYVVAVLLVTFFVYYWQNYRIKLVYAPHIFGPSGPGLPARGRKKTIRSDIGLSSVITTLLPMALVLMYFVAFVSSADLPTLSEPERSVLLGDYDAVYLAITENPDPQIPVPLRFAVPYLGVVDTILFVGGMSTAFFISLVMLVLISKWSTKTIVAPLEELRRNIILTADGDLDHVTPVRDTDEIGELAEQFNRMLSGLRESQKLRIEKEAAESANRAKSSFLATMSHELRTPLNAIIGFAQLLGRGDNLEQEQRENLDTITRSGNHLLDLINDVLDMSKIEAGRAELSPSAFDLHELLKSLEEMFSFRATDKGLTLIVDVAPEVPRYVSTDGSKLRQVIVNLLGNAVKFTQNGGATLRVRSRPEAAGAVRLLFEIEDTGPGIAAKEMKLLFEPFVQTGSGEAAQEGTGLGLAISKRHVSLLGGTIAAKSEPGKGSLFSFDIRATIAEADAVAAPAPRRRVTGLAPGQPAYRILVAEDRESNRQLLMRLLSPLGFEVRGVRNGAECVSAWETWEPQLIWMDMRMPVMDGYEATRRIKATARGQATVIIALTASAFETDRKLVLSGGCDDFVRKPFVEEEIYEKLEKHLGVRFETAEAASVARPGPVVVTAEALAGLPEEWKGGFRKATVEADFARLHEMIAAVRGTHPQAARALTDLVNGFAYGRILELLGGPR